MRKIKETLYSFIPLSYCISLMQYSPEYSGLLSIAIDDHQIKIGHPLYQIDMLTSTAFSITSLFIIYSISRPIVEESAILPILLTIYLMAKVVTEQASKGDEKQKIISRELARTIQLALGQTVSIASLSLCNSSTSVIVGSFIQPTTEDYNIIGYIINTGLVIPITLSVMDYIANFVIHDRLVGDNTKDARHSISNVMRGVLVSTIKIGIPYLCSSYNLSFLFGGLSFGISHFLDQLILYSQDKNKKNIKIADAAFEAIVYSAAGIIISSVLPIYTLQSGNIGLGTLATFFMLGLIDGALRHYIIPSLSKRSREEDEDKAGMTWKEKIDFAIVAIAIGAVVGFALNASFAKVDDAFAYVSLFGGFGILPSIIPLILSITGYIGTHKVKQFVINQSADKKLDDVSAIIFDFSATAFSLLNTSFGFALISSYMPTTILSDIIVNFCQQHGAFRWFADFMSMYYNWTGTSLITLLAKAFVMSFVLYGVKGLTIRSYEAVTGNKFSDKKNTDRHYMMTDIITRMPFEFLKYTLKGYIKTDVKLLEAVGDDVTTILANLAGFATITTFKIVQTFVVHKDFREQLHNIYNDYGLSAAIKLSVMQVLSDALTVLFDQFSYTGIDYIMPIITDQVENKFVVNEKVWHALRFLLNVAIAEMPQPKITAFVKNTEKDK